MKKVYVVRHANWDGKTDKLTAQGIKTANEKVILFPQFDIVICSPFIRSQQTSKILSQHSKPIIDQLASVPQSPSEVREQILARGAGHTFGIAGALFESEEAHAALKQAGENLIKLIHSTIDSLEPNQNALIISHDGTMVAAERLITRTNFTVPLDHTYSELEGFIVTENMNIEKYIE